MLGRAHQKTAGTNVADGAVWEDERNVGVYQVDKLVTKAQKLAALYRRKTGKTVAVIDAVKLRDLIPPAPDVGSYGTSGLCEGRTARILVKVHAVLSDRHRTHRLGQRKLGPQGNVPMPVVLDQEYAPLEVVEASGAAVEDVLAEGNANRRATPTVMRSGRIGVLSRPGQDSA